MELLTDLMDRFASIETRVVTLVSTLEEQQALEESFNAADRDLRDASTQVGQLAASMKETAESLKDILVEFRSAVQVIKEADPARVAATVAEAQEFIARQHAESQAALTAAEEAGARRHTEIQAAQQTLAAESAHRQSEIQAAILTSQEENASRHGETHAVLSQQRTDTGRGLTRLWGLAWGIIAAQAAGLALLAYIAFIK